MINFVDIADFKFSHNFINLTVEQLQKALQIINAQFSGVYSLWSMLPPPERDAKRELCVNYLLAWQLMTLYPLQVTGVGGTGGMPLASKKAGPVFIKYRDVVRQSGSGTLDMLTTNQFGLEALQMLQSAPENYMFY